MNNKSMVEMLAQGNPGAITFVKNWFAEHENVQEYIDTLKQYNIVGSRLYILWNDCCGRDYDVFFKTVKAIKVGIVDKKEIDACLADVRPWRLI